MSFATTGACVLQSIGLIRTTGAFSITVWGLKLFERYSMSFGLSSPIYLRTVSCTRIFRVAGALTWASLFSRDSAFFLGNFIQESGFFAPFGCSGYGFAPSICEKLLYFALFAIRLSSVSSSSAYASGLGKCKVVVKNEHLEMLPLS